MATKKFFFPHGYFTIKDGSEISFWEDKWLGQAMLGEQYHALYNIVRHKGDTLAKVMVTSPLNVSFRRSLFGPRQASRNALLMRLDSIQLTWRSDKFQRNLNKNGKLSVDYVYKVLIQPDVPVDNNKKLEEDDPAKN